MIMLLSSRGKARRSKSGSSFLGSAFLGNVTQAVTKVFGGKDSRSPYGGGKGGRGGAQSMSSWLALGAALLCFGAGYLVGDKFGSKAGDGADLSARTESRKPGVIGDFDARPMTGDAFVVAAYPDPDDAVARGKAKALCDFLVGTGLLRSRPYLLDGPKGKVWTVAVYYDGDVERKTTREMLLALTDVPDAEFQQLRRERSGGPGENAPGDWPISMTFR